MTEKKKSTTANEIEKIPVAIADGVPNLKSVSGRLKVLYTATQGGDCDYYEFSGFQDVARLTLEESIKELDEIIGNIEKEFYGAEGWPGNE